MIRFFFNDTAVAEICALSLHDALPIFVLVPASLITGAVVSRTVMVWLLVPDSLPQASTALHVFSSLQITAHVPGFVTSLTSTIRGLGSQTSVAVGGVNTGVVEHSMVPLAPALLITGGVESRAVMVCLLASASLR